MSRYYFVIDILPKEANLPLLIGRCIFIMHGFICKHNIKGLGSSLPAWSDKSIGNKVAFVYHDKSVLNNLQQQAYFLDMKGCGFFKLTEVFTVPDDIAEVRFKRNQSIAKIYVGESRRRLKRLKERAIARGENFTPKPPSYCRELNVFHRIAINSHSKQEDFILHIQKETIDCKTEPNFSNYGFATNVILNGSVPDLSTLVDG